MYLLRSMLVLMILAVLGGCGLGGSTTATSTPGSSARATEKPEATEEPEATTKPRPTTKPKPTTRPSSGGATGAIPAPPDSEPYVKGSDPTVDVLLETVEQEIGSGGIAFSDTEFYLSNATLDEIEDFYNEELPNEGWTGKAESEDMQGMGRVLGYPNEENTQVAIVGAFDLSSAGQEGLVVMTSVGEEKTGGSDTKPTTRPGTGGSPSAGLGDIPSPPDSQPYEEGDDSIVDIFVTSFTESVEGGFEGSGVSKTGQEEFTTSASAAEIKSFYDKEMEDLGWDVLEPTDNATAQILNYTRTDGGKTEVAVVTSVELSTIKAGDDTLVIVLVAEQD